MLSRGEFVVLYTKVIAIAIYYVDLDLLKAFENRSGFETNRYRLKNKAMNTIEYKHFKKNLYS